MKHLISTLAVSLLLAGCGDGLLTEPLAIDPEALEGRAEFDATMPEFLAAKYGLTAEGGVAREQAEQGLGELGDALEESAANRFGGAWIDADARGAVHVRLADVTDADMAMIHAALPAGYPVVLEPAPFLLADLEAKVNALPDLPSMTSAAVEEELGRIEVKALPGQRDEVQAAVAAQLPQGSFTVVEDEDARDEALAGACADRDDCGHALRGGIRLTREGTSVSCTLGFIGVGPKGTHFGITAAHCANKGQRFKIGSQEEGPFAQYIGAVTRRQLSGPLDVEAIHLDDAWQGDALGFLYDGPNFKKVEVVGAYRPAGIHKGMNLCKSGIRTGRTCGAVANRSVTRTETLSDGRVVRLTRQLIVNACFRQGDSGGPVYRRELFGSGATGSRVVAKAVAIATAGNYDRDTGKCKKKPWFMASYTRIFNNHYDVKVGTR